MAEPKQNNKPRVRKSTPEAQKQAEQSRGQAGKPRRIRKVTGGAAQYLTTTKQFLGREYYLPLPDTSWGRFLNKRRHWVPSYFRKSYEELRQVTWTNRRESWRLTFAVFVFAIVFGCVIAAVDKGLEELFKNVILDLK